MIPTVLGAQATGVCVPFSAITRKDVAWAGGKAANLGEMVRAGIPVPPGFVITTTAYRAYMTEHEIDPLVTEQLGRIGSTTNGALSKASTRIQEKMLPAGFHRRSGRRSSTRTKLWVEGPSRFAPQRPLKTWSMRRSQGSKTLI